MNQVAIWRPCGSKTLNVKTVPAGRRYRAAGSSVFQTSTEAGKRYAKDYTKSKVDFCLMVYSNVLEEATVEAQLDKIAKKVTKEQALKASANATASGFEYLSSLIKEAE